MEGGWDFHREERLRETKISLVQYVSRNKELL